MLGKQWEWDEWFKQYIKYCGAPRLNEGKPIQGAWLEEQIWVTRSFWDKPKMMAMIRVGRDGREDIQAEGPLQTHI